MSLEERIAKLKTSLAEKRADRLFDAAKSPLHHTGVIEDFKAGSDALAEVYRLKSRLDTLIEYDMPLKAAVTAKKLEALLKQMEEKV